MYGQLIPCSAFNIKYFSGSAGKMFFFVMLTHVYLCLKFSVLSVKFTVHILLIIVGYALYYITMKANVREADPIAFVIGKNDCIFSSTTVMFVDAVKF